MQFAPAEPFPNRTRLRLRRHRRQEIDPKFFDWWSRNGVSPLYAIWGKPDWHPEPVRLLEMEQYGSGRMTRSEKGFGCREPHVGIWEVTGRLPTILVVRQVGSG